MTMKIDVTTREPFNNSYNSRMSRVTKCALRRKRMRGEWCGKAPRGYLNIHDSSDHFKRKLIKDPVYFPRMKKAFSLMLTGKYSLSEIGEIVNINPKFLRCAFKKIFYAGFIKDTDDPKALYKGKWEPMVTKAEFDKIQKLLEAMWGINDKTA